MAPRAFATGLSTHSGRWDVLAGAILREDSARFTDIYRLLLRAARAEAIDRDRLPDFLDLEHSGEQAAAFTGSSQSAGAALATGGSAGGCLVCGPPGGLGGRLVAGVLADHRENRLGVRVVQSRYGLEDLLRLLEPADPLEFREVEREPLLTEIKLTERAEHIRDQPREVRSLRLEFGGQIVPSGSRPASVASCGLA